MTEESGEPAAVAFPSEESLVRKVSEHKRRPNVARVVSSSVSGCATLLFGAATVAMLVMAVTTHWAAALAAAVMGTMTGAFGFLTWRWARGLPPTKQLATNEQERDELE